MRLTSDSFGIDIELREKRILLSMRLTVDRIGIDIEFRESENRL
jgi:hypothetical protein